MQRSMLLTIYSVYANMNIVIDQTQTYRLSLAVLHRYATIISITRAK